MNPVVALAMGFLTIFWTPAPLLAQESSAGASSQAVPGKKLFLQRCSVCHLPPLNRPNDRESYGPSLNGKIRSTESETRAREVIAKGTPRMPGFQFGLSAKEIDDVIAYLKTM